MTTENKKPEKIIPENPITKAREEIDKTISAAFNEIKKGIAQAQASGKVDFGQLENVNEIQKMVEQKQKDASAIFEQARKTVNETFSKFLQAEPESVPKSEE